jgi:hypothetical protein
VKPLMFLLLILTTPCFAQTTSNSTLYIYTLLIPSLAVVFTLATLLGKKGIIPAIFASTLWYVSAMISTRIRMIGDYTVSMSTHYVDAGNWEAGNLFLVFAGIMSLYLVVLVLEFVYSSKQGVGV